jgi:hypothetical protein
MHDPTTHDSYYTHVSEGGGQMYGRDSLFFLVWFFAFAHTRLFSPSLLLSEGCHCARMPIQIFAKWTAFTCFLCMVQRQGLVAGLAECLK